MRGTHYHLAGHIVRNTNGAYWASRILDIRRSREFDLRRSHKNAYPLTRVSHEFVNRRWTDSIVPAFEFVNAQESKKRSPYGGRITASLLHSCTAH